MAAGMPSAASPPTAATLTPTLPIFVDTNLDTHLAMVVSWFDTVADLKGKIKIEHSLCFPDIGEITIQALKVRRRASLYHLSDSMLVGSAFDGVKGTWFLLVDAISTNVTQHQAGGTECIKSANHELSRNHTKFQTEVDSSCMPDILESQLPNFATTRPLAENNLIPADKGSVPEKLILPDDKDVELEHVELGVKHKHSEFEMPLQELEQRSDPDVPVRTEEVNETNEVARPSIPNTTDLLVDQPEKDAREEECGNLDANADVEYTSDIAVKKVKARKRKNLLKNDQSENIPVVKKKHKKGKDGSSGEPFNGAIPAENLKTSHYTKESSKVDTLETSSPDKQKEYPGSSLALASETLHGDNPLTEKPNDKKEKKKKKRSSTLHNEAESAVPSDAALPQDQAPQVNSVETNISVTCQDSAGLVLPTPLSTKLDGTDCTKEGLSEARLADRPLSEPITEEKPIDPSDSGHANLNDKFHAATAHKIVDELSNHAEENTELLTKSSRSKKKTKSKKAPNKIDASTELVSEEKTTKEATGKDHNDQNSLMPTKLDSTDCHRKELSKSILPGHPLSEPATEEQPLDPSDHNYANLNEKCNAATAHGEGDEHTNHIEEKTEPSTKSTHKKKKTKNKKEPNKIDDPSQVVDEEKTLKAVAGKSYDEQSKESHAVILGEEIADNRNSIKQGSEDPSQANVRSSRQRKKIELSVLQSKQLQTSKTPEDQALEENTLRDQQNGQVQVLRRTVVDETAALESDSGPHIPNEKKSRSSRKKSSKVDFPNHEVTGDEYALLGKDTTEENYEGTLETTQNRLGKDSKLATVHGEAVSHQTSAEVDPNARGKRSRGHKKKSGKTELSNLRSPSLDANQVPENQDTHKDSGTESTTILSDGTMNNMFHAYKSVVDASELLNDPSEKNEFPLMPTKKATHKRKKGSILDTHHDDFDIEAACDDSHDADGGLIQDVSLKDSVAEAAENVPSKMDGEPLETDVVDFIKHFVPKVDQNESAEPQEFTPMETESRKPHKEKNKKKRKSNSHPKDSSDNEGHLLKSKPQETNFALHDLADLAGQLAEKDHKTWKADTEKSRENSGKTEMHHGNSSPKVGSPKNLRDKKKIEKKHREYHSDMHHDSMSRDEQNMHEEYTTAKLSVSGNNAKSLPHCESNDLTNPTCQGSEPKNVRTGNLCAPADQTLSSDISPKEGVADRVVSDDSTEEDTSFQKRRYKVAVRKIPSKKFAKLMENSKQKHSAQTTSSTIFDGTMSGSSDEDAFEFRNRKTSIDDNCFASADSDGDHMDTPEVVSAAHDKNSKGLDAEGINLSQSSNTTRKSMPLSSILRSSSIYKKAKLTASQSQPEDSESQPVDVVLETQPDEE
ncbi:hypothetical protein J5N97_020786 [Dioscorea zingiberensis]|uniref:Uncharacterized protein n=1 Tax=Dioscorea zingiberensis TaxID=325984 RepID=A0A9D5HE42_9LILI|nr:hypothetical protein J5N97_020786 [Dioscorea zingiberensis]